MKTRKLTSMAILAALSVVMVVIIHFPIFPAAPYLEYDPADIPVLICSFAFGPWEGLAVAVIAASIQGLTVSASSGLYGIIMHILATAAYVLTAGFVYRAKKTKKEAVISLALGCMAMTAVMVGANLIVTPAFTGMPVSSIRALILPVIVPFNLIKSGINGIVTFFVYKRVSPILHKEKKTS